jgi:hypothetical protein
MANPTTIQRGEEAPCALPKFWKVRISPKSSTTSSPPKLPLTAQERLTSTSEKTVLYLAYGSNLSAETFKGRRGIKPLSAVNVHVPSLSLTFDLAGIPYIEPCFANSRYRNPSSLPPSNKDYHKDRWTKGLIGVVYEVTPEDYRTIIATEGGGASYHDVTVPCYVLPKGSKVVDGTPSGASFKAHTLLSPPNQESPCSGTIKTRGGITRPDPSYAQASARYLKLITDGGEEHDLPAEYMAYLYDLRPYTITTRRQKVGQAIFLGFWMPIVLVFLGLGKLFADDDGKIPAWLVGIMTILFRAVWGSYDLVFKKMFGDGERTIYDDDDDDEKGLGLRWYQKCVRLEDTNEKR